MKLLGGWSERLRERLQETLIQLCRIPSPTFEEREVADVIRGTLAEFGIEAKEDGAGRELGGNTGNLVAELPGGKPQRMVLVSHMDTVPPVPGIPLDPVVDGDRIHTAGRQILGADNKAGVSVALELLRGLAAVPAAARPTVIAVFTIAEEKGLRGARALDVAALKADFAYVLDGEVPVGQVIATAPYKASLKIVVKGRRAHAALEPEKGVHAIAAAAAVIQAFPLGRYSATAVTNLGTIQGGTATNVIPDEVVVHGEMRCFQKDELEQLFETSRRTSIEAGRSVGAAVEVERHYLYAGYDVPVSAPPLRRLRIAAEQVAGIQFEKVSSIGGSDTNILCEKGVTAVDVGLGMHEIHSTAEWILASDLEKVTLWLMAALLADAVEDR